jgi:hypothetical protein
MWLIFMRVDRTSAFAKVRAGPNRQLFGFAAHAFISSACAK